MKEKSLLWLACGSVLVLGLLALERSRTVGTLLAAVSIICAIALQVVRMQRQ